MCYAAVVADLILKTNIMLKGIGTDGKEELRSIRMRTKKGIEIIVTVGGANNANTLVTLQDCTTVAEVKPKEVKAEGEEQK